MALPDFDALCEAFPTSHPDNNPSELHGLACGTLAAGFHPPPGIWVENLQNFYGIDHFDDAQQYLLEELLDSSQQILHEGDFDFQLCLPDDDLYGLEERLESLGQFINGFLHGFGALQAELSEDADELIQDLSEIAQVNTAENDDNENERIYIELVEFVRLAVISLFLEYSQPDDDQHVRH